MRIVVVWIPALIFMSQTSPNQIRPDHRIYRQLRTANTATLEQLRDDATVTIVDARGLVAIANPYGSVIPAICTGPPGVLSIHQRHHERGIVQGEFDSVDAEGELVSERCNNSDQGASEPARHLPLSRETGLQATSSHVRTPGA